MTNIATAFSTNTTLGGSSANAVAKAGDAGHFLDTINSALKNVSGLQGQAAVTEAGFAAGAPGATLGKALVSSDRAEVAWSATVAVRNEVVSAYQSIMNMQF